MFPLIFTLCTVHYYIPSNAMQISVGIYCQISTPGKKNWGKERINQFENQNLTHFISDKRAHAIYSAEYKSQ